MKKVAIITARGGSKGLVDKNMLMVYGKPLLAYTIENAIDAGIFDEIILTTDSQEYIDMLEHYPITMHRRPDHLASDTASTYDALEELIQSRSLGERYDYFVLFQPTCPMRKVEHTQEVCTRFEAEIDRFDFFASITESSKPLVLQHGVGADGSMAEWDIDYSRYRRQNYPSLYAANGVYYGAKIAAYLEQKHFYGARSMAYLMDKKHSLDIDDRDDFEYFYFLVSQEKRTTLLGEQVARDVKRLAPAMEQRAEVTLIGDSFVSLWGLDNWHGKTVQNLSVVAIDTQDFPHLVVDKCSHIADLVYIGIGRDDLRKQRHSPEELVKYTLELIRRVKLKNAQAQIYLYECVKTHFRVDCDNKLWDAFNPLMREAVRTLADVHYIPLNDKLCNSYGKLRAEYTIDGYNLSEQGYEYCYQNELL